jgi:hypothetical protein
MPCSSDKARLIAGTHGLIQASHSLKGCVREPLLPLALSLLHSGLDWPVSGLSLHAKFTQLAAGFLFNPEDGVDIPLKRGAFFELFTVTPVTALNPKLL